MKNYTKRQRKNYLGRLRAKIKLERDKIINSLFQQNTEPKNKTDE